MNLLFPNHNLTEATRRLRINWASFLTIDGYSQARYARDLRGFIFHG
jgi:hypothetical protein